jgi:hypothetical protein
VNIVLQIWLTVKIQVVLKKSARFENRAASKREILFGEKMADKDINPGYTQTPARRALKGEKSELLVIRK